MPDIRVDHTIEHQVSTRKPKKKKTKKPVFTFRWWHYSLVFLLPLIVYGRTVTFGFVYHDDDKMILENPLLEKGIQPAVAFTTDAWFMDARIELYRPWQSISYMIDHSIGGKDPRVYHTHNLIIFLVGAILLFFFLRFYFNPLLALSGAMLYSVNLLTPHAVAWIAARGDLYLMLFGMIFLLLVQSYSRSMSFSSLALSVPAFIMALLSKESAIMLLPVAFLLLYGEGRHRDKRVWIWLVTCLAAFIGYYVIRNQSIADAGNMSALAFVSNLRSIAEETFKMFVPLGFSVMPGYHILITISGFVSIGLFIYALLRLRPDKKRLITGGALFLGLLLPSLAYEPSFAGVAYDYLDHRAWLPFAGLWLVFLALLERLRFMNHKYAIPVIAGVGLIWSLVCFWRVGVYQDWQHYYTNAIKTNPGSGLANLNYGSLIRDEGDWAKALPYIERGVELSPDYVDAKVRLAEAYYNLQKYNEAIIVATQAIEKDPANISALQFRGSAYGASGNPKAAVEDFKKILEQNPEDHHGIFNLGVAYKDANMLNEAIETFSRLLVLKPDFPNAYFERGFSYGKMGLFVQAHEDMERSIQYQPDHGPSYFFRGRAYEALDEIKLACDDWKKAFELGTKEAEAYLMTKCQF